MQATAHIHTLTVDGYSTLGFWWAHRVHYGDTAVVYKHWWELHPRRWTKKKLDARLRAASIKAIKKHDKGSSKRSIPLATCHRMGRGSAACHATAHVGRLAAQPRGLLPEQGMTTTIKDRYTVMWRNDAKSDDMLVLTWRHSGEVRTYAKGQLDSRIHIDVEVEDLQAALRELQPADGRKILMPVTVAQKILPKTVFAEG
jgi:hypothetical protein